MARVDKPFGLLAGEPEESGGACWGESISCSSAMLTITCLPSPSSRLTPSLTNAASSCVPRPKCNVFMPSQCHNVTYLHISLHFSCRPVARRGMSSAVGPWRG